MSCEACGGYGFLLVNIPPHHLQIQRCDACDHYLSDLEARVAFVDAVENAQGRNVYINDLLHQLASAVYKITLTLEVSAENFRDAVRRTYKEIASPTFLKERDNTLILKTEDGVEWEVQNGEVVE